MQKLLVTTCLAAVLAGVPASLEDARPASLPALPDAARAVVSRTLGRDAAAYRVRRVAGTLAASNPAQGLEVRFTRAAVRVRSGSTSVGLRLRALGYAGALTPAAAAEPRTSANRVSYRRGPLVEWYENGPLGLEQGFTLASPPAGPQHGPLTVTLALSGASARIAGPRTLAFAGSDLRYAGLAAYDAAGRQLAAWLELRGRTLLIRLADAGATYPLTIDPFLQQARLAASDGQATDGLGSSIAVSADGQTIVAGAPLADGTEGCCLNHTDEGAAYVFVKPPTGWANATETARLSMSDGLIPQPTGHDLFGTSVAISGDTIVVGAPDAPFQQQDHGALYVFVEPPTGWTSTTETAKLLPADNGGLLGQSVAIGAGTIAAGAPVANVGGAFTGAVYVFTGSGGSWAQAGRLTAAGVTEQASLGRSVAISSAGDTIAAAAPAATVSGNADQGAVYVFAEPVAGWADGTETAKLTTADGAAQDALGTFGIALSGDGSMLVAGSEAALGGKGAAYVFTGSGASWAQAAELSASDGAAEQFGGSVAIGGTDTVVVGAPGAANNRGEAYLFTEPSGGWADENESSTLTASDGVANDRLGTSVAASPTAIVAGAPGATASGGFPGPGAAYVFGTHTLTLRKRLFPASDAGRFDLKVGSTVVKAGAGDGDSGALDLPPGTYTIKETAVPGTTLSSYASSIDCTLNGATGPSGTGTSLAVSVAEGDQLDCTFTNERRGTITVRKSLSPAGDPGRFELLVGSTVVKSGAGNGDTGTGSFAPGTYAVSEASDTGLLSDYFSSVACRKNGKPDVSGSGSSIDVTIGSSDAEDCTITNVRKATATLTVKKFINPSSDAGKFTFLVDSTLFASALGNGGSHAGTVNEGTHTIVEQGAGNSGTQVTNYVGAITCTKNGQPDGSVSSSYRITITLAKDDDEVCTFTNTRKPKITLTKALSPANDPGRFDLKVDTTTVANGVGNGGSGSGVFPPGAHTVSESGGGTDYTSSIACDNGQSGNGTSLLVSVGPGGSLHCTFTNVRKQPNPTITVSKTLVPATDAGRFDLKVGGDVVRASAGNGDSGGEQVAPGSYSVGETAATGSLLSDYVSSIACRKNGAADVSGAGTSITVTVAQGDGETCTITNRRKATVTLRKSLAPTSDAGRFTLKVGSTAVATAIGDGGSGSRAVPPGTYLVKEVAAAGSLADYASSIACTLNGGAGPSGAGTSLQVTLAAGDALDCTFTNLRDATISVAKSLAPADDPGRFDLLVGPTVVAAAAGDGGSGATKVAPGTYAVSEQASSGSLADYVSSIVCTKDGSPDVSGAGTSILVTVAPADTEACTIQNRRNRVSITLRKALVPSSDAGRFDLLAGSTVVAAAAGDGASGTATFAPASFTLKERPAAGSPALSAYDASIACTLNGAPGPHANRASLKVTLGPADALDCTFTNVRRAKIAVRKVLSPTTDPGRFDLLVGSLVVKAAAGNGDSGSRLVGPGTFTVHERASSGSLGDYTSSIVCTKNGSPDLSGPGTSLAVTVAAGDVESCKVKNTRK